MNRRQRINYHKISGLNLIPCYYLKEKRIENHFTLSKVEEMLDFEGSYLNKMENGICEIPENILRTFINAYSIDFDQAFYCDFDRDYVEFCFDSICHSTFSAQNYSDLCKLIEDHQNSFYKIYLKLIQFGYKSFKQKIDDDFLTDYKYFKRVIELFDEKCQVFYHLFSLVYAARNFDTVAFDYYQKALNSENVGKWKIIQIYSNILMVFNTGKQYRILRLIEECKQELENFSNSKIYNSLVFFRAMQYTSLHDYSEALSLFKEYCQICAYNQDYDNYGIGMNSIASIYANLKQYSKAIECYLKAMPYINYPDFYFDMAWCYYSLGDETNCLQSIQSGMKVSNDDPRYMLYLEWLEIMVNAPYSKRAKQKLKKIYKEYYKILSDEAKTFLLIALLNQARFDGNIEEIMTYTKLLIELNVKCNIEIKN